MSSAAIFVWRFKDSYYLYFIGNTTEDSEILDKKGLHFFHFLPNIPQLHAGRNFYPWAWKNSGHWFMSDFHYIQLLYTGSDRISLLQSSST